MPFLNGETSLLFTECNLYRGWVRVGAERFGISLGWEEKARWESTMGKVQYLVFSDFSLVLRKFSSWDEERALDYNLVQF